MSGDVQGYDSDLLSVNMSFGAPGRFDILCGEGGKNPGAKETCPLQEVDKILREPVVSRDESRGFRFTNTF